MDQDKPPKPGSKEYLEWVNDHSWWQKRGYPMAPGGIKESDRHGELITDDD